MTSRIRDKFLEASPFKGPFAGMRRWFKRIPRFEPRYRYATKTIEVGPHTYGRPEIFAWKDATKLSIGKYCSIAEGVKFVLGGEHRTDWISTYPFSVFFAEARSISGHPATKGDIVVGHDVWIGMDAIILSGLTIGHGAVVATRSVVAGNVPPYAIVGGIPAKIIRFRFNQSTIDRLLAAAWWDWPDEKVRRAIPLLLQNDVEEFLVWSAENE